MWATAEFGEPEWPTKIAVGIGIDLDHAGQFWCAGHVAWGDIHSTATRQVAIEERAAWIESVQVPGLIERLEEIRSTSTLPPYLAPGMGRGLPPPRHIRHRSPFPGSVIAGGG
jgi:hypothetical protein